MNTPTRMTKRRLLLLSLLAAAPLSARAEEDCTAARASYDSRINQLREQAKKAETDADKNAIQQLLSNAYNQQDSEERACQNRNREAKTAAASLQKKVDDCNKKREEYPDVFSWNEAKKRCDNKSEQAQSRVTPESDECGTASVFNGDLKGQNCKKAMSVVKDVKARNGALSEATTAATTVYSNMQATGATGAQDDAQARQANIMKTLALSKIATGALNLSGAMQLKSAASAAEDASSTITGAQKNIQQACSGKDDDQACFYQNAGKYGITPDARSYASYSRMRQGAQQSQDQADAANALAKSSMLQGAADLLVGLQAMKAAQLAQQNAQNLAPPPMPGVPMAPPAFVQFGDRGPGAQAPSLEPGAVAPPVDYGNPHNDATTFGAQKHGRIEGTMSSNNKMGTPNGFKSAASGVSGGGGGGGVGGGGLRGGGGGGGKGGGGGRRNTTTGEYNLAGGGPKGTGGGEKGGAAADNPLADMLSKLFPQNQQGQTVVDARQVASAGGAPGAQEEAGEPSVTAADLSLFEQISAKYRQLDGTGRF